MADMITVFIENENMLAKESNREFRITLRETSTIRELYQQVCETAKIKLGFVALSIIDDKTLPPDSNNKLKDHDIVANSTIKLRDMMITVFIRRTAPKIDKDQNDIDVKPNNQITMVVKKILTVKELYQKVCERVNFDLDKLHLIFNNSYLRRDDDATIEYYHITTNSNITIVHLVTGGACRKHYQIGNRKIDASVRFSTGTCVLLLVNDDDISKRVEMPCGHAVTPDGLAEYVDAEIRNKKQKLFVLSQNVTLNGIFLT